MCTDTAPTPRHEMTGADPAAMTDVVPAVSLGDMGRANRSITGLCNEIQNRGARKKPRRRVALPKPSDLIRFARRRVG